MVKKGSVGTIDDWEFSMEKLPSHEPIIPTGRISCASCHEHYEKRGFISKKTEQALLEFLQRSIKGVEDTTDTQQTPESESQAYEYIVPILDPDR